MNDAGPGAADGGAHKVKHKRLVADPRMTRPLAPVYPRQAPESPREGPREVGGCFSRRWRFKGFIHWPFYGRVGRRLRKKVGA
ncbi:hypothetical protein Pisl_1384 [Pyrobaculum islandicum DSM 4184]|uniref:Uncharacterized protein n=1 Tax=Pyrobaculum islandicum (strain DSM 4184 / JCM 9189 / GEO3) TaxID=384616 RepID=A1RUB2_PYRIL|nr:hypothetical protein Pisl_1384 [Pyrobaculum islandicum DSM 4184]